MIISTKYNIGDTISIDGKEYCIVSMHIYQSAETHKERYYLGDSLWVTLGR